MSIKKVVLVCFLLLGFISGYSQNYTDEEIGYNEEEIIQNSLNDGVVVTESQLIAHRLALVELYEINTGIYSNIAESPEEGCGNIDFQNGFVEWCYRRKIRPFGGGPVDWDGSSCTSQIPTGSGSQLLSSPYSDDDIGDTQYVDVQISAEDLQLNKFGDNMIRLGDINTSAWVERIEKIITVTEENRLLIYSYAIILEEPANNVNHDLNEQPYFSVFLETEFGDTIDCSPFYAAVPATGDPDSGIDGFIEVIEYDDEGNIENVYLYRPFSENIIDLLDQGIQIGDTITIIVEVADCSKTGHFGYAFFEGQCGSLQDVITVSPDIDCQQINTDITFNVVPEIFGNISWTIYDITNESNIGPFSTEELVYNFSTAGTYIVKVEMDAPQGGDDCVLNFEKQIVINDPLNNTIVIEGDLCASNEITFSPLQEIIGNPTWNIYEIINGDEDLIFSSSNETINYTFTGGTYLIELLIENNQGTCFFSTTTQINITHIPENNILMYGGLCLNNEIVFYTEQEVIGSSTWNIYNGSGGLIFGPITSENLTYNFSEIGTYTIELEVQNDSSSCLFYYTTEILLTEECECECNTFAPISGKKYILSAWVKENHPIQPITYSQSYLELQFLDSSETIIESSTMQLYASGGIIDGWQMILREFEIPQYASFLNIDLVNGSDSTISYFDDIRIHPFNANLKSFVYDSETLRLMAELDENNYATLYEYDKEGGLVRVKKETERGIYTIQETRSGNSTLSNQIPD